jgi:hypothetical protein
VTTNGNPTTGDRCSAQSLATHVLFFFIAFGVFIAFIDVFVFFAFIAFIVFFGFAFIAFVVFCGCVCGANGITFASSQCINGLNLYLLLYISLTKFDIGG